MARKIVLENIIRRHEQTDALASGLKADRPTPNGLALAYQKGIAVRNKYPDSEMKGYHSETHRTKLCCAAWMMGTGNELDTLRADPLLNLMQISSAELEKLRNIHDVEVHERTLFERYHDQVLAAGKNVLRHITHNLFEYHQRREEQRKPRVNISISHGPPMDAAYVLMIARPLTYEVVMQETHVIQEGEGFNLTLFEEGKTSLIELCYQERKRIYRVDELEQMWSL